MEDDSRVKRFSIKSKTKYMQCSYSKRQTNEDIGIRLGNKTIQQMDKFKYLGSIIQEDCEVDDDVNNRIQTGWFKWRKVTGVICDRKVQDKVKRKFYRTMIRSAMLYGSECWALKRQHEHKMEVAEMRMLRWMCSHTIKDRIPMIIFKKELGQLQLQIKWQKVT